MSENDTETPSSAAVESSDVASESVNENTDISPQYLQRKLYFLLENLKKMHSEIPE